MPIPAGARVRARTRAELDQTAEPGSSGGHNGARRAAASGARRRGEGPPAAPPRGSDPRSGHTVERTQSRAPRRARRTDCARAGFPRASFHPKTQKTSIICQDTGARVHVDGLPRAGGAERTVFTANAQRRLTQRSGCLVRYGFAPNSELRHFPPEFSAVFGLQVHESRSQLSACPRAPPAGRTGNCSSRIRAGIPAVRIHPQMYTREVLSSTAACLLKRFLHLQFMRECEAEVSVNK
ncbi:hypothetical protein FQA47_015102 [Oryzias melastigma]|uniref:Uncharacterized protein n=1 Tax=Oryzias melastigma TaxID=30732 RepID=A0A834F2Q1_ORYME|nr:hypothetical protein FQA47_015102 [Oryzias melastigma]